MMHSCGTSSLPSGQSCASLPLLLLRALFGPITPPRGLSYNHRTLGVAIVPAVISRRYIIERVVSPAVGKVTH